VGSWPSKVDDKSDGDMVGGRLWGLLGMVLICDSGDAHRIWRNGLGCALLLYGGVVVCWVQWSI